MRLLLTTDTIGGVWTYTRELTEGLLAAGCDVILVSFGRLPSEEQQAWTDGMTHDRYGAFRFVPTAIPLEWMAENGGCYTSAEKLLLHLIADESPDVLHANQMCFGALPTNIPKLIVVHSDVLSWWEACRGGRPEPSPWISEYEAVVRRGLSGADCVVAPTAWMLGTAERLYGRFRDSLGIPNGRQLTFPASARQVQAVTIGRLWDEAKGVALLRKLNAPMPLLIVGETKSPDGEEYVDGSAQLLGPLPEAEIAALLTSSTIYIATSVYEPFGLAPLEAALCGCALLLRDLASFREVWGDAALYFGNAASLSDLLSMLHADPQQSSTLAIAAEKRANALYGRGLMVTRYLAAYRGMCETRGVERGSSRHVA